MRTAASIVDALRARGDLWDVAPGLVGMRGPLLTLRDGIDRLLARHAAHDGAEPWSAPAALSLDTLGRADYFACFPQWLTAASHLGGDIAALEAVASSPEPATAARAALRPADVALPPAACYHVHAALADTRLDAPRRVTLQCTCWRHEEGRHAPLARGWAFTMREVVLVGGMQDVDAFLPVEIARAEALADALGIEAHVMPASDPFFLPASSGRALLQRLKALKHELRLDVGDGETVAAASFNHHERFFGAAFGTRLADGAWAASGCAAFGVERWLLAFLVAHGVEPAAWPALPAPSVAHSEMGAFA